MIVRPLPSAGTGTRQLRAARHALPHDFRRIRLLVEQLLVAQRRHGDVVAPGKINLDLAHRRIEQDRQAER